jgi:spermidine/putrescine transport system permease protein
LAEARPDTVPGLIPEGVDLGPPPRQGERVLARRKRLTAYALLTPGGLYLALGFIVPLILIVYTSLESGGILSGGGFHFTWEWSNYRAALQDPYASIYERSLAFAAIATLLSILLSYPMAYWIAFYGGKWKATLFLMILVPFFVSFVIRTVQWNFILGDNGLLFGPLKNHGLLPETFRVLRTRTAVIAGITYNYLPFTALPLYVSLERIDRRLVEAAKDLYASRFEAFRRVVVPLTYPGIFAAVILTFVPATGDFVNADVLGSPSTTVIGQVINTRFHAGLDYPLAAAMSVILMVGMLLIALVYARILGTEDEALAAGAAA